MNFTRKYIRIIINFTLKNICFLCVFICIQSFNRPTNYQIISVASIYFILALSYRLGDRGNVRVHFCILKYFQWLVNHNFLVIKLLINWKWWKWKVNESSKIKICVALSCSRLHHAEDETFTVVYVRKFERKIKKHRF